MPRYYFFRALGAIAVLLAVGSPIAHATAFARLGTHTYIYQGYFGGFHIAELEMRFHLEENRYRIETNLAGRGLMQSLLKIEGDTISTGFITKDSVYPDTFQSRAHWRGTDIAAAIQFSPDLAATFTYSPEEGGFDTPAYDAGTLQNTIDPVSMSLHIAHQMMTTDSCAMERRLFSGRNRHDATTVDMGTAALPKNDIVGSREGLHLCRFNTEKIYPKDSPPPEKDPVDLWLYIATDDPRSLPYPILLESEVQGVVARVWLSDYTFTPRSSFSP